MTSIEDRLRQLRENVNQAQAKKARSGAELDAATEKLKRARAQLAEFGVESLADASKQLTDYEAELATIVSELESALAKSS